MKGGSANTGLQLGLASVTCSYPVRKQVTAEAFGRFLIVSQQQGLEKAGSLLGVVRGR